MCEMACVCRSYPIDGFVVETEVSSWSGKFLYSDCSIGKPDHITLDDQTEQDTLLNKASRIVVVGILAGITRMALAIIHTIGHLFLALFTRKKGHLFHAAKGTAEFLRGLFETLPIGGRIFSSTYNPIGCGRSSLEPDIDRGRTWWILKIYNPKNPDNFDRWMNSWQPSYDAKGRQVPFTLGGPRYLKA